jgi:GTP1/Obg family GTP-binding protein
MQVEGVVVTMEDQIQVALEDKVVVELHPDIHQLHQEHLELMRQVVAVEVLVILVVCLDLAATVVQES